MSIKITIELDNPIRIPGLSLVAKRDENKRRLTEAIKEQLAAKLKDLYLQDFEHIDEDEIQDGIYFFKSKVKQRIKLVER